MKRLLRYLQGTINWGIILDEKEFTKKKLGLHIYVDAAFGDDPIYCFSTDGYIIMAGDSPLY